MAESEKKTLALIRDPNLVKNRIYVGNLPSCTREELESICKPYAKVLASLVQKNYGFVQFESEEIANRVAKALTKSTFKGNTIAVRNANWKMAQNQAANANNSSANSGKPGGPRNKNQAGAPVIGNINNADNPGYNDCEIIVVDRKNTAYAEMIESRLNGYNLSVDVLYPNEDVPLGRVLANIASRGCLYAILVTNQHEEHNSITVNILHGQPAEHRNMPMEDAIKLIADDFRRKLGDKAPVPIQAISTNPIVATTLKERHPDAIQALLNLVANNMPLTVLQYDHILKYLQERRAQQLKVELGDSVNDAITSTPDPEIEVQKKILSILNKPSVAETHYDLLYPTLDAVKGDIRLLSLLKDTRVQNALDSLMDSNLVATIESQMKF